MSLVLIISVLLAAPPHSTLAEEKLDVLGQWPQWRGPLGTGVAPHGNPPVIWSENHNIRWKIPIPGKGHSTPVVWGDRIFLTTAILVGDTFQPSHDHATGAHDHAPGAHDNVSVRHIMEYAVLAINRHNGTLLWRRTLHRERPHASRHETGSWASNSPVTDGEHLFASFGSGGIYGLDMSGKLLWQKNLGHLQIKHGHGEGSSLALSGNTLITNWDHEGESFVIALDKRTGKQRWKVRRDESTSWSTPLVVKHDGKHQVIIAATKRVRAYDLETGQVIWECGGLSGNVVASPVAADGFVYVANSYETRVMLAIRLEGARGDITGTDAVVWTRDRYTPYVPSPLLYDDRLYYLKHYQGYLSCVNAKTGKTLFGPQRLPDIQNVYASLVGAANRVYIVSRNGTTDVIEHSARFKLLSSNYLDDSFSASPVIVGSELYLRGERHLYCISRKPDASP